MVTTVTLNPCIDRTVFLPQLVPGGFNLIQDERLDAGGKGVNTAIVLNELGTVAVCTGINFNSNGNLLTERLSSLRIKHDFVYSSGNIRENIKIVDQSVNELTEINSPGHIVGEEIIGAMLNKLEEYASKSRMFIFSGRIPYGSDDGIYARCIKAASKFGARVLLDAEKSPLKFAVNAEVKPYIIRINARELNEAFGYNAKSIEDISLVCKEIISRGIKIVCVSMGSEGAVIADAEEAFYTPAIELTPKGFQGAGDSMAAGVCKALLEGGGLEDMLRMGTAAAAATVIREGTLLCRKRDYEDFLPKVRIYKV